MVRCYLLPLGSPLETHRWKVDPVLVLALKPKPHNSDPNTKALGH